MGKQRYINTDFWTDTWVVDTLNPLDCHLFMYLLTNDRTNLIGVYELSLRIMSFQIGLEKEEVARMIKRLEPKVHYIDGWVVLRNGVKHQNYRNEKIKAGILREAEGVPSQLLQHVKWPKDFGNPKPQGSKQKSLFDDSSMTHEDSLHLTKPNLTKLNPVVPTVRQSKSVENSEQQETAGTTGLKKLEGRSYTEVSMLYEDLQKQGLVNDKFKGWYCQAFFKLGREKVLRLASEAKADGKDPQKLFNHLVGRESGLKQKAAK